VKSASTEIELKVGENGDLHIPSAILHRLRVGLGNKVHVRLTSTVLSGELRRRNVTEGEIERIAAIQLEPRDNVVKFLTTESKFAGNQRFKRRAKKMRGNN
jgi:hypothetical protein